MTFLACTIRVLTSLLHEWTIFWMARLDRDRIFFAGAAFRRRRGRMDHPELGMKFEGRISGHFRDDERWDSRSRAVVFTLDVTDDNGRHAIPCLVTQNALAEISATKRPRGTGAVKLYRAYRNQVRAKVNEKFSKTQFGSDGSIVVRSGDLQQ